MKDGAAGEYRTESFSKDSGEGRTAFLDSGAFDPTISMAAADRSANLSSCIVAVFCAALSDLDRAIAKLDKALATREPHLVMLKVDPRFDPIRDDERFRQIINTIGFPAE